LYDIKVLPQRMFRNSQVDLEERMYIFQMWEVRGLSWVEFSPEADRDRVEYK
jgi:hypothetical protein